MTGLSLEKVAMNPAVPESQPVSPSAPFVAPISPEAERLGVDLGRFLSTVPVAERGSALAHVLTKAFDSVLQPSPDSVPDELLAGFQDNFPAKQVFPPAFLEWARKHVNLEEVMAEYREIQETGGLTLDEYLPELEKLAKSHE